MWEIALFSTNTYYPPNTKSEVSLSTLGTTDPMADPSWLKVPIIGAGYKMVLEGDAETSVGQRKYAIGRMRRRLDIKVRPLVFPDEMDIMIAIAHTLINRYVYIYRGSYEFDSFSIHSDGHAAAVVCALSIEDDYDSGTKHVTLSCDYVVPGV